MKNARATLQSAPVASSPVLSADAMVAVALSVPVLPVVTMLETMAARAGIVLENIQPSTEVVPEGLPVVVTVRGNFQGMLSFVEIMEKNVRPVRIGPVNITGGETELSATFNVVVLYQVPAEDLPAVEAAPTEGQVTP